jgi:uncharacterized protein (DUF2344 family)
VLGKNLGGPQDCTETMTMKIKQLVENELIFSKNREIHSKHLLEELERELEYLIFDHCCSLVKQVTYKVPQERIRIWFKKVMEE